MNPVKAFNNLLSVKNVFDALGMYFWLDGGTCLGAYKENGFLESDFDVDVGIFGEDDKKVPQIIEDLKKEGFGYFHLKEHPCGEGKQISCIKHGISLDIFFYYRRANKRWRLMFDFEMMGTVRYIPCVLPASLFDKFEVIDFMDYGVKFNMPSPTTEYLGRQYGDWRINKTKDEFHWQSDYKCMDMDFEIFPKPEGKRRWILTEKIAGCKEEGENGTFFKNLIKEGYKLFPISLDKNLRIIDGKKRLKAYKELKVPMVECYTWTK